MFNSTLFPKSITSSIMSHKAKNATPKTLATKTPRVTEKVLNGTPICIVNDVYQTEHFGTLIYNEDQYFPARTHVVGLWTIQRADGTRFRNTGYLRHP